MGTSGITVKEFIEKLAAGGGANPSPADCVKYGLQRGWLETQDAAAQEEVLQRKHAARIIHNFLRLEWNEPDEIDGSPAYVLRDLFDCRVCAGHIIQVYVKGIMDGVALPDGKLIFNTDEVVSEEDLSAILTRVFFTEFRAPRLTLCNQNHAMITPEEISLEQVRCWLEEKRNVLPVDVRTEREFEQGHFVNAINVPLISLIKNPFVFSEMRDTMLLLYCEEGMQSEAAARCLLEAGYENVAYFAWKERR